MELGPLSTTSCVKICHRSPSRCRRKGLRGEARGWSIFCWLSAGKPRCQCQCGQEKAAIMQRCHRRSRLGCCSLVARETSQHARVPFGHQAHRGDAKRQQVGGLQSTEGLQGSIDRMTWWRNGPKWVACGNHQTKCWYGGVTNNRSHPWAEINARPLQQLSSSL